ncbi:hypothetical protein [Salipaludibacillus aurantiacus]|uniref:Uncharacterized protein n=1 Tax=Salipaludibacillus aurantiacus TaxID=1601833 RepID=A0A1H9UD62_9BACI|nr:hypothetical protein [Salipaludibacillus aurantiacus]SES07395.1 hypothetical protein SAMN05518684_107140 [Salipaludibacillus aurantiacus]
MGKKVKSVSFNTEDPTEADMYEYAKQYKYFSTYMKRLLYKDMMEYKNEKQRKE